MKKLKQMLTGVMAGIAIGLAPLKPLPREQITEEREPQDPQDPEQPDIVHTDTLRPDTKWSDAYQSEVGMEYLTADVDPKVGMVILKMDEILKQASSIGSIGQDPADLLREMNDVYQTLGPLLEQVDVPVLVEQFGDYNPLVLIAREATGHYALATGDFDTFTPCFGDCLDLAYAPKKMD